MRLGERAKFLCQVETVRDIFRRDEILGDFYTVVKIANLMGSTGRNENGIAKALNYRVTVTIKGEQFVRF